MKCEPTFDIATVCSEFGITSRTLRYYEEIELIESVKSNNSKRRRYTKEQIERIRYIVSLRSIGLSIKAIKECLNGNSSIKEAVNLHRAQIEVSINDKLKEIHMLKMVLDSLDEGQELGLVKEKNDKVSEGNELELTKECSIYIVTKQLDYLYRYFCQRMKDYMPQEVFAKIWEDTITGLGEYLGLGDTTKDVITNDTYDIYYQVLNFEKMKIQLKFVYSDQIIVGLWMDYIG